MEALFAVFFVISATERFSVDKMTFSDHSVLKTVTVRWVHMHLEPAS